MYIDTERDVRREFIKRTIRLADMVPGLKQDSRVHWKGPCPFCGEGDDRFEIKATDDGDLWHCRKCAPGPYSDVIAFLERRDGISFSQVVEQYGDGAGVAGRVGAQTSTPRTRRPLELERPPDEAWQKAVGEAVDECAAYLYSGETKAAAALDYYYSNRMLIDATIQDNRLGFNSRPRTLSNGLYMPRGLTVPARVDGQLWSLKVRLTPADEKHARAKAEAQGRTSWGKYPQVKGGSPALYGADRLIGADVAFVVEGEFDALVLGQYCPPEVAAVTMGGAGNLPGPAWLRYFAGVRDVLLCLDEDDRGQEALARWQTLFPRARLAALPWGQEGQPARGESDKDVTDFRRAGGNLVAWVAEVLR